jgi:hypothetical protein
MAVRAADPGTRPGPLLYLERKSEHADRIIGYVEVWRDHGEELNAGKLETSGEVADDLGNRSRDELYAVDRM